ncbi:MAG: two-component system sensor histidine kinase NtrB [Methylocystis sp.]|jgi:two-component system sensor kinase FixL
MNFPNLKAPPVAPSSATEDVRGRAAGAREDDSYLTAIVNAVVDGVITIDERGVVLSMNPAAAKLFGFTPSEVIGQNVRMLMPEPDRGKHDSYISEYRRTGAPKIIGIGRQVEGMRKDGSIFPMELGVSVAETQGKRVFVGLIHDLSQTRRFERRLHELQTNRFDLMENMAAGLAHELKQPLAAIAAYINFAHRQLKQKDFSVAKVEEMLDGANAQVFRASEIIDNLRQFIARGETVRTPQNLNAVVRTACEFTDAIAKEHNVKTTIDLEASPDTVVINKVQIQQVVVNLKRNAIEAMQNCERREMRVSTRLVEANLIRVDVADTGPGLPQEINDRLFEQFTTTKPHGLGVGLSISRAIIEAHRGKIWAEPNPGGGTIFSFVLPLEERQADA